MTHPETDIDTSGSAAPTPRKRLARRLFLTSCVTSMVAGLFLLGCYWVMIRMPGRSWSGALPAISAQQIALRDMLTADVQVLAGKIGQRNIRLPFRLDMAASHIEERLKTAGYVVERQTFEVGVQACHNLVSERQGADKPDEIIVIGAHYDTVPGCDGANDNGSGVAALLALADAFSGIESERTLRFVAFVNEEPPYFQSSHMGSVVYAQRCAKNNDNIVAMLSLETMGYYTDELNSQRYPRPLNMFYPTVGNFVAIVGDIGSRALVHEIIASFRRHTQFPSQGVAAPAGVPGIGWSDHWSFWQSGYPAVMITDTALFRYPDYHRETDTVDRLDYDRLARVVDGLREVIADLAGRAPVP